MFIYVTIFYNEKEGKMDDEILWKPDVFEFLPFTILSRVQPLPIPTVDRLRTRRPATLGQNLNKSFKLRETFDFFLICKVFSAKSGSMKKQIQKLSFVHDDKFQNVKPMAAAVERFEFKANTSEQIHVGCSRIFFHHIYIRLKLNLSRFLLTQTLLLCQRLIKL